MLRLVRIGVEVMPLLRLLPLRQQVQSQLARTVEPQSHHSGDEMMLDTSSAMPVVSW